jgi:chromosomal replication initiation ATPase DnaA
LDLSLRPALGREDFLVAASNAEAVALIDAWPRWPSYGAIIIGPRGSGKSHLGQVWQHRAGAALISAHSLRIDDLPSAMSKKALLVEDVDHGSLNETALFHVMNAVRDAQGHLLMTSSKPVQVLGVALADLRSRLAALPVAAIRPPDDQLLRGILVKHFADRQIAINEAMVSYLLARMPRSPDMARQLVAAIDQAAMEQGAEVTKAFAGKILASLIQGEFGSF